MIDPAVAARLAPVLMAGMDKLRRDGLGHVARAAAGDVEDVLAARVAGSQPKVAGPAPDGARSRGDDSLPSQPGRLITVQQAASRLAISRQYVRRLAATGRVRAVKVGHVWLVDEEAVDGLRDAGREGAETRGVGPGAGRRMVGRSVV